MRERRCANRTTPCCLIKQRLQHTASSVLYSTCSTVLKCAQVLSHICGLPGAHSELAPRSPAEMIQVSPSRPRPLPLAAPLLFTTPLGARRRRSARHCARQTHTGQHGSQSCCRRSGSCPRAHRSSPVHHHNAVWSRHVSAPRKAQGVRSRRVGTAGCGPQPHPPASRRGSLSCAGQRHRAHSWRRCRDIGAPTTPLLLDRYWPRRPVS